MNCSIRLFKFTAIILITIAILVEKAESQCSCGFQCWTAGTNWHKCGFESFTDPGGTNVANYYLTEDVIQNGSGSEGDGIEDEDSGSLNADVTVTTFPKDCSQTNKLSGSVNLSGFTCGDPDYFGFTVSGSPTSPTGWQTVYTETYFGDSTTNYGIVGNFDNPGADGDLEPFNDAVSSGNLTASTNSTSESFSWVYSESFGDGSDDDSYSITYNLSSPYADSTLAGIINGMISPPSDFPVNSGVGNTAGSASFSLDSTHVYGSGTEMWYRPAIPCGGILGATYHCQWQQVTKDPNGVTISIATETGTVSGTGNPTEPAVGGIIPVPVPGQPSTITEENPIVTSVDPPGGPPPPPGSGGTMGGGGS